MYISSKFKSQLSFNWDLNLSKVCATQSRSPVILVDNSLTREERLDCDYNIFVVICDTYNRANIVIIKNAIILNIIHNIFNLCDTEVVCPFVLFLLAIVLSVLLRCTDSDYPLGIFKHLHFLYMLYNISSIKESRWPQSLFKY
jgi:hypothetical protein